MGRTALLTAAAVLATTIAGCSSGDRSTIEIRARSSLTDPYGIAGIQIGLNGREYTAEDFNTDRDGLIEVFAEVPNSGELLIEMELIQNGEMAATGSFTLQMTPDFEWGMDIFRQADDPTRTCIGCAGSRSFLIAEALQNEAGEAIWFAWGGTRRGSGAIARLAIAPTPVRVLGTWLGM